MFIAEGLIVGLVCVWVVWSLFSSVDEWLQGRRDRKQTDRDLEKFNKSHHYDDRRQRWVRNEDGAVLEEYGYREPISPEGKK